MDHIDFVEIAETAEAARERLKEDVIWSFVPKVLVGPDTVVAYLKHIGFKFRWNKSIPNCTIQVHTNAGCHGVIQSKISNGKIIVEWRPYVS